MIIENEMENKILRAVLHLASEQTNRICDDLSQEEIEMYKGAKVIIQDENGKNIFSKIKTQGDLVSYISDNLRRK